MQPAAYPRCTCVHACRWQMHASSLRGCPKPSIPAGDDKLAPCLRCHHHPEQRPDGASSGNACHQPSMPNIMCWTRLGHCACVMCACLVGGALADGVCDRSSGMSGYPASMRICASAPAPVPLPAGSACDRDGLACTRDLCLLSNCTNKHPCCEFLVGYQTLCTLH